MNIEIKVIKGHWTVNGNRLSEMNYTEQKFLGEFFQFMKEQKKSEQLVCEYCNDDAKPTCCDSCLESMVNAVQKAN